MSNIDMNLVNEESSDKGASTCQSPQQPFNIADLHENFHYDVTDNVKEIAEKRGQIVVLPEPREVQIDLDGPEQEKEFYKRIAKLDFPRGCWFVVQSKNVNRFHAYVEVPSKEPLTNLERLAWQATLGDDPTRVVLNMSRVMQGMVNPSCLFEHPDFKRAYPVPPQPPTLEPLPC